MQNRIVPIALFIAIVGAGVFALVRPDRAPEYVTHELAASTPLEVTDPEAPAPPLDPHANETLPPNHPPIDGTGAAPQFAPASDSPQEIAWTKPAAWKDAPNPNTMRLATYRIAHVGSDTEDAEVSVSQAGGATDANIARWVSQFKDAGKEQRTTKKVHGLTATTVEVSGTYTSGMMMGGAAADHPGWMLVGAIVETEGAPYFFKMTGPAATVKSARAAFDAMIDGVTKK